MLQNVKKIRSINQKYSLSPLIILHVCCIMTQLANFIIIPCVTQIAMEQNLNFLENFKRK